MNDERREEKRNEEIAKNILLQLGGYGKLSAMAGAYDFLFISSGICFKFRGSRNANFVEVDYDEGSDLYTISFEKVNFRKAVSAFRGRFSQAQASDLVPIFENVTGLYLRLM